MMKKNFGLLLALGMLLLLAGCGQKQQETVDLKAFYQQLEQKYDLSGNEDITKEMQENFYPGLSSYSFRQFVAKAPMISFQVEEYVFAQCQSEEDAAAVAQILQKRINDQANGGAWYPESVESWEKAKVLTHGEYVAMIASATAQAEIEQSFNELFA